MDDMTVSALAQRVGTSADTIRYYERIGLLPEAERSPAGYRLFGEGDVERVAFIKRAQSFGLRLDDIGALLDIRQRGLCPCGHARQLLSDKLAEIDQQIQSLEDLRNDVRALMEDGVAEDASNCWPCGDQLIQIRPLTEGNTR
ncbi:MAG: heavy metal-responsive transcriptional regulator [Actinobacteria bacterium]|nr:heavy metal-responsive transcriptional regulator [Actinomycetota bacterium]